MTSNDSNVACFIPARGGKQSLPRKNLLPVGGVPLVVRAIRTMRTLLPHVPIFVSTEDPEIRSVSLQAGAEVIERPPELSLPSSDVKWAAKHACDEWASQGFFPDTVLHHEANLVLVDPTLPARVLKVSQERSDVSGIQPIEDVGAFKQECHVTRAADGCIEGEYLTKSSAAGNRQNSPCEWRLSGGLCMFRPSNFEKWNDFGPCWYFGRQVYGFPTKSWQAVHIDSEADRRWAEFCLQNYAPHLVSYSSTVTEANDCHS